MWQPIETAPKDGRSIIVYAEDGTGQGYVYLAHWVDKWPGDDPDDTDPPAFWYFTSSCGQERLGEDHNPRKLKYWMPHPPIDKEP